MMKIKTLLFLGTFVSSLSSYAQSIDEMKTQIASIKKNSLYLYAEATCPTKEDAQEVAEELLYREINEWVAKKKKLQGGNIVVNNKKELQTTMSLPRGNMFRSFIYVKKSDIIPTSNAEIIEVQQSLAPTITPVYPEVVNTIASYTDYYKMADKIKELKAEGKISYYARYASLEKPEICYLAIYNPSGQVVAVLTPGVNRVNVKTGKDDKVTNYSGCGAIGFVVNEK